MTDVRISQTVVEELVTQPDPTIRLSHTPVEVLQDNLNTLRLSHTVVEVMAQNVEGVVVDPPGADDLVVALTETTSFRRLIESSEDLTVSFTEGALLPLSFSTSDELIVRLSEQVGVGAGGWTVDALCTVNTTWTKDPGCE